MQGVDFYADASMNPDGAAIPVVIGSGNPPGSC